MAVTKEQRHQAQVDATRFNRVHGIGDPCEVTVNGHLRRTTLSGPAQTFTGRAAFAYVAGVAYPVALSEIRMLPREPS